MVDGVGHQEMLASVAAHWGEHLHSSFVLPNCQVEAAVEFLNVGLKADHLLCPYILGSPSLGQGGQGTNQGSVSFFETWLLLPLWWGVLVMMCRGVLLLAMLDRIQARDQQVPCCSRQAKIGVRKSRPRDFAAAGFY